MANDSPPAVVLTAADARRLQLLAAGVFAPVRGPMDAHLAESVRTRGQLADGTPWSVPFEFLVDAPADALACALKDGEGRTLGQARLDTAAAPGGLRRVTGLPSGLQASAELRLQLDAVAALPRGDGAAIGNPDADADANADAAADTDAHPPPGPTCAYVVEDCLHRSDIAFLAHALPADGALLLLRLSGCADEPCHLLHATALANQRALAHLADALAMRAEPSSGPADRPGGAPAAGAARVPRMAVLDLPRFDLGHPAAAQMLATIARNLGATSLLQRPDAAPRPSAHRLVVRALIRHDDEAVARATWPDIATILRAAHLPAGRRGFTVLLTGLSGAGKSTIARMLSSTLMTRTMRPVSLLDGDLVRQHLSRGLGFGRADREANLMRIAFVAREVTRHGGIAICAPIAPYAAIRGQIRDWISELGEFVEVHVATPIDVCEQRDPKGLYALARAGELRGFTGIDDPYEPPANPELRLDTSLLALPASVDAIVEHLLAQGLIRTTELDP